MATMVTGTLESFERDLLDCGVPPAQVQPLGNRYARALESGSPVDWIELYVGTFATLMHEMHCTGAAKSSAAQRMLRLLNDDLGADLFDAQARAHLAHGLAGVA